MSEPGVVMPESVACGYVLNCTRRQYLATRLAIADGHWSRLRGLMGRSPATFRSGDGLWILPCKGVHTMGMRFPIDVVYLTQTGPSSTWRRVFARGASLRYA